MDDNAHIELTHRIYNVQIVHRANNGLLRFAFTDFDGFRIKILNCPKRFEVLVEGESKKNKAQYFGRNSQNKVIVFDNPALPDGSFRYQVGDYAMAEVLDCTPATLLGRVL